MGYNPIKNNALYAACDSPFGPGEVIMRPRCGDYLNFLISILSKNQQYGGDSVLIWHHGTNSFLYYIFLLFVQVHTRRTSRAQQVRRERHVLAITEDWPFRSLKDMEKPLIRSAR